MWVYSVISVVSDSVTPWTIAHHAPLSTRFSRQENWSGLPHSPLGHLPNSGIESRSPALLVESLQTDPTGKEQKWVPTVLTAILLYSWCQKTNHCFIPLKNMLLSVVNLKLHKSPINPMYPSFSCANPMYPSFSCAPNCQKHFLAFHSQKISWQIISIGISLFCPSCKEKHWLPLF